MINRLPLCNAAEEGDLMAQLLDRPGARGSFRPSPVVPLPEQIRRQLVEAVAMGDLRPGDRLPGEATLASQFGASAAEA